MHPIYFDSGGRALESVGCVRRCVRMRVRWHKSHWQLLQMRQYCRYWLTSSGPGPSAQSEKKRSSLITSCVSGQNFTRRCRGFKAQMNISIYNLLKVKWVTCFYEAFKGTVHPKIRINLSAFFTNVMEQDGSTQQSCPFPKITTLLLTHLAVCCHGGTIFFCRPAPYQSTDRRLLHGRAECKVDQVA